MPKGHNVVRRHQRHHDHDGTDSDLFYCDVFEVLTSIRRIVRCTKACAPCLLTRVSRTFVGFVGNQYKKICHYNILRVGIAFYDVCGLVEEISSARTCVGCRSVNESQTYMISNFCPVFENLIPRQGHVSVPKPCSEPG